MYQVYCRGRKNCKWRMYSQEFNVLEDAERCKKRAEERQVCDVHDNLIAYKIVSK